MTPAAMSLLAELRAAGLHLEPRDNGKVHVRPLAALTLARRQAILTRKAELLAALELERRICAMGSRWAYSTEELAEALEAAQVDPTAWLACVARDEENRRQVEGGGHAFLGMN